MNEINQDTNSSTVTILDLCRLLSDHCSLSFFKPSKAFRSLVFLPEILSAPFFLQFSFARVCRFASRLICVVSYVCTLDYNEGSTGERSDHPEAYEGVNLDYEPQGKPRSLIMLKSSQLGISYMCISYIIYVSMLFVY